MGLNLQGASFFIEIPNGKSIEIKATQNVNVISNKIVDSDFGIGGEINGTFTWEEPENVKELQNIGFTRQQAWDIHLRKGKSLGQI
ncbi:PadR family transcriptional regulator [Bacillus cereus]|nr:PadR family transcriptional regulator [Bacillus cereus]